MLALQPTSQRRRINKERQFILFFIVTASGLHLASADAPELRVETVPHRWLALARRDRGVRRQSTLYRGRPSFDSFSPFERWSASTVNRPVSALLAALWFTVHPAGAGAFLIRAGDTRHTVPPRFPTGIGFDPFRTLRKPSRGREGHLTAATPTDLKAIKD